MRLEIRPEYYVSGEYHDGESEQPFPPDLVFAGTDRFGHGNGANVAESARVHIMDGGYAPGVQVLAGKGLSVCSRQGGHRRVLFTGEGKGELRGEIRGVAVQIVKIHRSLQIGVQHEAYRKTRALVQFILPVQVLEHRDGVSEIHPVTGAGLFNLASRGVSHSLKQCRTVVVEEQGACRTRMRDITPINAKKSFVRIRNSTSTADTALRFDPLLVAANSLFLNSRYSRYTGLWLFMVFARAITEIMCMMIMTPMEIRDSSCILANQVMASAYKRSGST